METGTVAVSGHTDRNSELETDARFILVLEKYAIFQRIIESDFYEQFKPCLLLTVWPQMLNVIKVSGQRLS